jgi:hypothetical protein
MKANPILFMGFGHFFHVKRPFYPVVKKNQGWCAMAKINETKIYAELENLATLLDPQKTFDVGPESLDNVVQWLRINIKYLQYDLEATRREVQFLGGCLRKKIDGE